MSLTSLRRLIRNSASLYLLAIPILFACDSPSAPGSVLGRIWITTSVIGLDYPPKFGVEVTGAGRVVVRDLTLGDSIFVGFSKKGTYSVKLNGLPSNCRMPENPQTVNATTTSDFRVQFNVTCSAVYGVLRVSMSTSGEDADPTGYKIQLNGGRLLYVRPNGVFAFDQISGGTQTANLSDVASNCRPVGSTSQSFTVAVGGPARDTATIAFNVACTRAERFAFRRHVVSNTGGPSDFVMVADADGSEQVSISAGLAPAWSQAGTLLAFPWITCDSYYYFYYGPCSNVGLAAMNYPTGSFLRLTNDSSDADPSWRPDGNAIAFERRGQLFVLDATKQFGSSVAVPIPAAVTRASQPAWSPDGSRIAFTCAIESGTPDICVIAPDGSGFVRLTTDPLVDTDPEWSPDGTQIVFSATAGGTSELALIASAGGAITRLAEGRNPAWSRDGTRILFEGAGTTKGIFVLTLSSTTVKQLTFLDDHDPTWRP